MTNGIVMVATGTTYVQLAALAIDSIRQVEPDVGICLFTDQPTNSLPPTVGSKAEIRTITRSSLRFGDKINSLRLSPYEKTVYLDVDIIVVRPFFQDLLKGLDHFPVLVRDGMDFNVNWEVELYGWAITQPNTGVIALNGSDDRTSALTYCWEQIYRERAAPHDQPAFRAALLNEKIPYGSLSHDFNTMPNGFLSHPPRILHFTGESGNRFLISASPEQKRNFVFRYLQPFEDSDCGSLLHIDHNPVLIWSNLKNQWVNLHQKDSSA